MGRCTASNSIGRGELDIQYSARMRPGLVAAGCRLEAGGWRLEAGGCRLQTGGWRLEAAGCRLEAGGLRPPVSHIHKRLPQDCNQIL